MSSEIIKISLPFEILIESVRTLSSDQKQALWKILDIDIAEIEEDEWETSLDVRANIQAAKNAYAQNDVIGLHQYLAEKGVDTWQDTKS